MDGLTGFDIIVLIILGVGAVGGFLRGFVQEVLSLAAWILAVLAIRALHTPLTEWFLGKVGTESGASVLAFALLLLVPYAGMKLIASWAGRTSRKSVLGPIDRALGFGFGLVKGLIIVVMAFSVLVLGYDTVWGVAGRPSWITTAKTYPYVEAASETMVTLIEERQKELDAEAEGIPGA
jgi:membrane protein required for colicin V production